MINSIQIKSCPPYDDSGAELKDCKKVNFIYGANGSGKTTISEFLRDCSLSDRYNSCNINWDSSEKHPVYVYNRQFRQMNFLQEKGIPGVFTLGQDAIEDIQVIESLKIELEEKEDHYKRINSTIESKKQEKVELESEFKKEVWNQILKRYEADFVKAFDGFRGSKDKFFQELHQRISNPKGNLTDKENLLKRSSTLFKGKPTTLNELKEIPVMTLDKLRKLCNDSIWNQVVIGSEDVDLGKLIKLLDNSSWVYEGIQYIREGESLCPFCQKNTIDEDFKIQLSSFFDQEYTEKLEYMKIKKIEFQSIFTPLVTNLNYNLQQKDECEIGKLDINKYQTLITQIEGQFEITNNKIDSKIREPEKKISFSELIDTLNSINELIISSNANISQHNKLVNKFEVAYRQLVDDVWCYCINESEHLLISYTKKLSSNEKALSGLRENKQTGFKKIKEIKDDISKKSEKLTSVQPAVDQINNTLKAYGFTSFHIEPYSEIQGEQQNKYRIVRDDGSEATHTLSEGEATFITFLYFMQLTRGAIDKEKVNEKKIIVLDDPISSLDSNILYIVSAMVKDLAENIKNNTSDVEQLFIFTHNVYFHKEASFIDGRTLESKDVNFWIVRKNNGVSKIQSYGMTNPISSTYELLWKELREDQEISLVSMQNIMRRIIENYFKITGQKPGGYILSKFESQEEKLVCESLLYWINDGSHTIYDDLHIDQYSDISNIFREVFKDIFDRTGHIEHYNMMMCI
jgi:wobble nucleotide-excising tRNase